MRTDQITGISSNFEILSRIDIKVNWMTKPINQLEQKARENFMKEMQELADFVNSTLSPNLLQMWENLQKVKVSNGN